MADDRDDGNGTTRGGFSPAAYLPMGIGIGLAIGAGLGLTIFDNIGIGMGIGLAIGAAIGAGGYGVAYASGAPTDGSKVDDNGPVTGPTTDVDAGPATDTNPTTDTDERTP